MQRDMDIIRTILLRIEQSQNDGVTARDFPDREPKLVNYHLGLVMQAGLAKGKYYGGDGEALSYDLFELTWPGHEFLDSLRDESVWREVKTELRGKLKSASFGVIVGLAEHVAKRILGVG